MNTPNDILPEEEPNVEPIVGEEKPKKKKKKKKKKPLFLQAEEASEEPHGLYWTRDEPRKALSVFLRNQNKFIVTSITIADRKSMIMIRVNSTLASVAIFLYRDIMENVEYGWLIGLIMIIGSSTALILAILAAKPHIFFFRNFFEKEIKPKYPTLEYYNFMPAVHPTLQEYEESMDKVVRSQELQIGNQVRFTYMAQQFLGKKYLLLDWAYNIFLGSFLLIGIVFIIGRCTH